ncbi:hypothetical protein DIS18_08430 [Algibacter marinivivus]|uniref:Nucleoside 2-deoxyribosyltransferase n=1 Tax=Algibacter marinivivus TaxID=2100723 RepID=A0A2U2X3C3_9FLAO|nr:hypothetical protein [Algibacter marinivivus]PWH82277.1 hypothetical protein DIS18_08430 [Algibacter marinivivus]
MKYHLKIEYDQGTHFWHNYPKEEIIDELLVPFVNGQIVLINIGDGNKAILNMKSVAKMIVYRTRKSLTTTDDKSKVEQMNESEFAKHICTEEIINEAKLLLISKGTSSLLQKSLMTSKNQVFVISKFGDKVIDSAYEGVIKPLFKENGIDVVRVDEIQDSGKIDDQILNLIAESKYIISDLTSARPNCYYETGFAHALGKEIILTIRKEDEIHFDLAGYRFIQWETESELRKELKKRIKGLIE